MTGKRFRLKTTTLAIEAAGDYREAVHIPEGEVVLIVGGPRKDDKRMVDVLWNDRALVMFAEDVEARGEEIK